MPEEYGLIGYPLGHSFSVPYFTAKFLDEGVDARYRNFPLESIGEFPELIKREPDLKGLNVTVPYKKQIIPYLDVLNQASRRIGAVNTIFFCRRGESVTLLGYNTDAAGFEGSLKPHHRKALVLGTGGSSGAVEFVLEKLGIAYTRVSRKRGEGLIGYEDLDSAAMKQHPLVINTTPLGMHPDVESCPDIPYEALTEDHLLFDLVYNPEVTRFLERGRKQGAVAVNGLEMLVLQAEASWEIWNRER